MAAQTKTKKTKILPTAVDPLERDQLAAQYKSAIGVIYSVPEIRPLFEKAVAEKWEIDKFVAEVRNSDWYRNNNQYARTAWAQESIGGEDWKARLQDARLAVQQTATQVGAQINDQELDALAKRYLYDGWYESSRSGLLLDALSQEISYVPDERGMVSLRGGAADFTGQLRELARANGVRFSDSWYLNAAQAVTRGDMTARDAEGQIRTMAASMFPSFSDQIRSGMNVYDIASPYIATMAQEFQLPEVDITLDDPYIRQALTNMDQNGNAMPMNLWDFQKKLRQDPRWENTAKAQNQITSVAGQVMQMFGLMGG